MTDIRVSPEVLTLVGEENIQELHGEAFERYECWRCGKPGRTTTPTSVIVFGYEATPMLKFAHAECADSRIIPMNQDRPADLEAAGFEDMHAKAAVVSYATPPKFRALLVLEPRVELAETSPSGERRNLWISQLLNDGLTLMRSGGQFPEPADDWRLYLPDFGSANLTDRNNRIVYDGECVQWHDWREVVAEVGGCVVLIGTVGIYAISDEDTTSDRFRRMLNQAARAGALAGGLVRTDWNEPHPPLN